MAKLIGCVMFDKISNEHKAFTFCNSKEEYIRSMVELCVQQYKNLNDLQPVKICEYDTVSGDIVPCKERFSFDCYKMPLSKADALAPLGVDFAHEALEFEQWRAERNKNKNKEE